MNCEECKANRGPDAIPYIAHEAAMARAERSVKRLWIVILVLIFLLVGSNCAWLWYESQFEYIETTQEVTQEAENGTNNFVGGDLIGEADGQNQN